MMNMNQVIPVNKPDASSGIPAKRKRGRPRKYPKLNAEDGSRIPKMQRMRWEENAGLGGPPGFGGVNGNQPRPAGPSSDGAESMVGRAVSGVIEAVFDAGYLLNVRVANSDTTLRGVIFRPGRFVPVSAENDVAPNVQMIRRTEIPAPAEHYNPRPRERKEQQQVNTHRDVANNVPSKGKQVSSAAVQTARPESMIPRGNLVPVVLEPGKSSSNGLTGATEPTPLATQASHIGASKGKLPQEEVTRPPNGLVSTTRVPIFGTDSMSDAAGQKENGTLLDTGAKSFKPVTMPFENLVTEVIKRIETPSQLMEVQAADDNTLGKKKEETNDNDQALDIEPLQAVLINDNINKQTSAPKPMEIDPTSKMSQLLKALQGTISESPVPHAVAPKMSENPSLVAEHGSKEPRTLEEGTTTQASLF